MIKKRGEADSEGRLERSEGKSPRPTQWDWVLPESQRKRPSVLAASQRDSEEARRSGQRGRLERSEDKTPAAAQRRWILSEPKRKQPSALAALQRDSVGASCVHSLPALPKARSLRRSSFPRKAKGRLCGAPIAH